MTTTTFWAVIGPKADGRKVIKCSDDYGAMLALAKATPKTTVRRAAPHEVPTVEVNAPLDHKEPTFEYTPRVLRHAEEEYSNTYGVAPSDAIWNTALDGCGIKPKAVEIKGKGFVTYMVTESDAWNYARASDLMAFMKKWAAYNPTSMSAASVGGDWAAGA